MVALRFLLALSCMLLVAFPAHAERRLSVDGHNINYLGRAQTFHGISLGDPFLARRDRPFSDYEMIATEWNANLVRISIHPGTWKQYGARAVTERLQDAVEAAKEHNMFVIIDWHAIGIPNGYMQSSPENIMKDVYDTDFALAMEFWRTMARTFGREGTVMFELWNEPVFEPKDRRRDSGWSELKPFWEKLVATIRSNGGSNVLLITGSRWGYDLRGIKDDLIEDDNVAYSWHVYEGREETRPGKWIHYLTDLSITHPVIVTEWGPNPTPPPAWGPYQKDTWTHWKESEEYLTQLTYVLFGQMGLHSVAWVWHPVWTPSLINGDWKTPTPYGEMVKGLNETLKYRQP